MPATIPLNYDKIILLGDSLTEYSCQTNHGGPGLGPMIENAYMRKVDVLFRGYAGYNSDGAKYIVPRVLAAEHNQFTKVKLMVCFNFNYNISMSITNQIIHVVDLLYNSYRLLF